MSLILFALQHVFIMKNRALIINAAFALKQDILPSANADQQVKFLLFSFWRNGKEMDRIWLQATSCFSWSMIVFPIWKNIIQPSLKYSVINWSKPEIQTASILTILLFFYWWESVLVHVEECLYGVWPYCGGTKTQHCYYTN